MNVRSVYIYRRGGECRAVVTEGRHSEQHPAQHVVSFKAGRTVSWRKCVDRALACLDDARMVHGSTYAGETVNVWPDRVSEVTR